MEIEKRIRAELAPLEAQAQIRRLEPVRGINLVSNDYLGLAADPRMKQAALETVQAAPRMASTGSRLLSGHRTTLGMHSNAISRAGSAPKPPFTSLLAMRRIWAC